MGHDIYAYEPVKISYLRRSMWSKTIKILYELLGASDSYQSVSGNGDYVYAELETFKDALKEIRKKKFDEEDKDEYLRFLNDCIIHCFKHQQDGLIIQFT